MNLPFEVAFEAPAWQSALGAAAAVGLAWLAWRVGPRGRVWALRAAVLAAIALSIAQPVLVRVETAVKRPSVAVFVDASSWMAVTEDGRTRLASALAWLGSARGRLEKAAEVVTFRLGDGIDRLDPASFGEAQGPLKLDRALRAASGLERWDQVWLLSGGVGDLSEDLDGALASFGAPIHAAGVGRVRQSKGVAVSAVRSPDFVFLHEPFPVGVDWDASGLAGRRVRVRVKRGGQTEAESVLLVGLAYETFSSSFTLRAKSLGTLDYTVELETEGGAVREGFRVESIRQKLRVLYLCGRPSFEYAALREFLKSDPSNELVSFVILRNQENVTPVPENELSLIPFPAHEIFVQSLFEFDLFIFQDFAFWRFGLPASYLDSIRQFVQRGGALLVIGGENAFGLPQYRGTPIEELLPVALPPEGARFEAGLFRPRPRDARHPLASFEGADWDALPLLDGRHRFGAAKAGAAVIADGPGGPVFALKDFGKGRVFLSGAPSTWRWKLGAGLEWRVGGFYERFWDRVFDYLTGNLDLSRVRFAPVPPRQPRPVATLHVFDESFKPLSGAGLDVQVLRRDGARWEPVAARETRPGVFQAELPPGRHELRGLARYQGRPWGEDRTTLAWSPPATRFAPLDETLLRKAASKTGGAYARLADADPDDWLAALPRPKPVRKAVDRTAVWAHSGWLWSACALLILEWYLRRRKGWR